MHLAEIFMNILAQLIFFCVNVLAISLIVDKLGELCMYLSSPLYTVFAAIGTPFHELSHALMCLLFGHRIYEFRPLFIEKDGDGICFGRISHGYREGGAVFRVYQTFGNYFIGTAPVVFCSLLIMLAMRLLMPEAFAEIWRVLPEISKISIFPFESTLFFDLFEVFCDGVAKILKGVFVSGWRGVLFVILAIAFSLNMSMSLDTDFIFSLKSVPLLTLLVTVLNLALGFADFGGYMELCAIVNAAGLALFLVMVLALAVVLAVTLVIIFAGSIIKAIK